MTPHHKRIYYLGLTLVVIYLMPYYILGENAAIRIHDNLDSSLVWVKILLDDNLVFSAANVPVDRIMNGVPRASIYGLFDLSLIPFKIFGMYWGYVINKSIMALVGFFGMHLLLGQFFKSGRYEHWIHVSLAVVFAILPFWSFNLSVAGLPMVAHCFLLFRKKQHSFRHSVYLIVFAFYSSLILSGFFVLCIAAVIWLWDFFRLKRFNRAFFWSIATLALAYICSHYLLFSSFILNAEYVSHRFDFTEQGFAFKEAFREAKTLLMYGQFHAHSKHRYFIFYPVLLALLYRIIKKEHHPVFYGICAFIMMSAILYGCWYWEAFYGIKKGIMDIVPIQLHRFHFLHPLAWVLLFASTLYLVVKKIKPWGIWIALILVVGQTAYLFKNHEILAYYDEPHYGEFFAEDLFEEIKEDLPKDLSSFRVISLGMHPTIAQYNGLYTLDGYSADYPLEYKRAFEEVILPEISLNETMLNYFQDWGSRCYAFSSELEKNYLFTADQNKRVSDLKYNWEALKKLGGQYLISAVEIRGEALNHIEQIGLYEDASSAWKIRLYRIQ